MRTSYDPVRGVRGLVIYKKDAVDPASWIRAAEEYVRSYSKENLLTSPEAENDSQTEYLIAHERAAGFQSDARIRQIVSDLAMRKAKSYLVRHGYLDIRDVHQTESYDFGCNLGGVPTRVEVKGTQTKGESVLLTKNEVELAKQKSHRSLLYVLHSIRVDGKRSPRARGGIERVLDPWDVGKGEVFPSSYVYMLPPSS